MYDIQTSLTIPANTLSTAKIEQDVALGEGIIRRVIITFKKGCRYMAYTSIWYGGNQIMPHVVGEGYHYDAFNLFVYPDYPLTEKHHIVTIKGWSDGTLYPHTLLYNFTLDDNANTSDGSLLRTLFGG